MSLSVRVRLRWRVSVGGKVGAGLGVWVGLRPPLSRCFTAVALTVPLSLRRYDPQPSLAEVLLPTISATSFITSCPSLGPEPSRVRRRSLLALLVDDAHAVRARRIAREEEEETAAKRFEVQARNFAARQKVLYR